MSRMSRAFNQILLWLQRNYSRLIPLRRGHRMFSRLIRWNVNNFGFRAPYVRDTIGNKFEYSPEFMYDVVMSDLFLKGSFEDSQIAVMRRHTPRGGVFVDVGANIGYFTILASGWVGSTGRVISIEPVPSTFEQLQRNLRINRLDNVIAFQTGCYSHDGRMEIIVDEDSAKNYMVGASEDIESLSGVKALDTLLGSPGLSRLDFLKIDTEGAEFEVLKGASAIIQSFEPVILLEIDHLSRYHAKVEDVINFLSDFGYIYSQIDGEHSSDLLLTPRHKT